MAAGVQSRTATCFMKRRKPVAILFPPATNSRRKPDERIVTVPKVESAVRDVSRHERRRQNRRPACRGSGRALGSARSSRTKINCSTCLLLGLPMAVAAAGIGGYVLARRALAPVDRMAERARSDQCRAIERRLPVDNPDDELGRLATVFNETLTRLESSFEQMRRFTADASHELRTPLTAIRSVGEVGLRGRRDEVGLSRNHRQHARGSRSVGTSRRSPFDACRAPIQAKPSFPVDVVDLPELAAGDRGTVGRACRRKRSIDSTCGPRMFRAGSAIASSCGRLCSIWSTMRSSTARSAARSRFGSPSPASEPLSMSATPVPEFLSNFSRASSIGFIASTKHALAKMAEPVSVSPSRSGPSK